MYVVDDEIFRFLPTVVVGTLDKAAIVSMQTGMRGLVGAPIGYCPGPSHGHTYASRSEFPQGCLVPGCEREPTPLPQSAEMYGMTFRLQDELHLLRDSLGAVDSHYEGLLDEMQRLLVGHRPKVVASSATLTGYERQVEVLYQRSGRVFPQKGLDVTRSYWSSDADPAQQPERLLRRFVAVSPRGATHEFVHDRTVEALQRAIRRLVEEREDLCVKLGIEPVHVQKLIDLYGVDVVYGTTLRDVEAAQRSFDTQIQTDPPVKSAALTGRTPLEEVRRVLTELESPPEAFEERLHLVAASSMLSHGVDVERFNVMVMIGLPLTTAEFIQTTARVGRRYPGLVYVLHRVARERDAAIFRQFGQFIRQGDRFVEPIPVTRRSRRVLDVTLPGLAEARRVQFHEPRSRGRLTTVKNYVAYLEARGKREEEFAALLDMLGVEKDQEPELARHVEDWVDRWWHSVEHPPATARFPSDLLPDEEGPMQSLRDVEQTVPVVD